MEKDLNFLLFDKIRQVGRLLRAGCPPGKIAPKGEKCEDKTPAFKRELVLAVLLRKGGGLNQKELADEVRVCPSTLSEMLNKLEADGFLTRKTNQTDKRATVLSLTDKGAARAEEIREESKKHFAHVFKELTDEEKTALITLLDKIVIKEEN